MSGSVRKAFDVLRYLSRSPRPLTLTEIAGGTGLNKATALRYLTTLVELDMMEKKKEGYTLGLGLFALGAQVDVNRRILSRIMPVLEDLCRDAGVTVSVAELHGDAALYVAKIESSRGLQFRAGVGDRLPLHCTGVGKSILTLLEESELSALLDRVVLEKRTRRTITSRADLLGQVHRDRRRGYSLDDEELEEGLRCVAVPLYLPGLEFTGAVSFSAHAGRLGSGKLPGMVAVLKRGRERIRAILGE